MDSLSLGRRIIHYRRKAGMTQKDLAGAAGISASTLNRYERDKRKPTVDLLARLAKALGITGDILTGMEHPDLTSHNSSEYALLNVYRNLNKLGQNRALEYIYGMSELPKYSTMRCV